MKKIFVKCKFISRCCTLNNNLPCSHYVDMEYDCVDCEVYHYDENEYKKHGTKTCEHLFMLDRIIAVNTSSFQYYEGEYCKIGNKKIDYDDICYLEISDDCKTEILIEE